MFRGSIPAELRSIVAEASQGWTSSDVYVGCSGNFTIERVLQGRFALHSNDVQLYSCAVGGYFSGSPLDLSVRDGQREEWGWLDAYLGTPIDTLATVMLSTEMLVGHASENAYLRRMRDGYRRQWPALHARTTERIEGQTLRLESYLPGDVMAFVETVPDDQTFACFPPFFAGDYEAMYASLGEVFTWQPPEYELYEPAEALTTLLERMRTKRHWLLGTRMEQPDLADELLGIVRTTNRGVPIYLYGDSQARRFVRPRQNLEPVLLTRLQPGETLAPPLFLSILTGGQFATLRSQYMNALIEPGEPSLCVAVHSRDRLLGVFAYSTAPSFAQWGAYLPMPYIYLLSDFPVAPVTEDRLSKLIVYAAMSSEATLLAERTHNHRVRSIVTTARTRRRQSMKYRGPMRLLNHKDDPKFGNELNYGAAMGKWTLQEAYERWRTAS